MIYQFLPARLIKIFSLGVILFSLLVPFALQAQCPTGSVIYVRADAPAGGNGQSWATAYNTLQAAINAGANCTTQKQIWVAKGTYYPTEKPWNGTSIDNRDLAFYLRNNLSIYGGFAGTETVLTARNSAANPTILSGDIGTIGNNSDNCYHVLVNVATTATALLNGFTITGGNANGSGSFSFTIGTTAYQLSRTSGGGMYNTANAQAVFANLAIVNNKAADFGGGIYNFNASPAVTNAVFYADSANYGGGVLNENAAPALTHTTFYANNATSNGGAIRNYNAAPTVRNSVIWGNTGGGMQSIYSSNGSDTTKVLNCIVQGSTVYNGNTNISPQWRNPALSAGADASWMTIDDGLQLLCGSPAINTAVIESGYATTDILGVARPQGNAYDKGAYEYVAAPPVVSVTANTGFPACAGTNITFTAAVTDVGNAPVYQWYANNVAVGANSSSFTYTAGLSGDVVHVKLNNGCATGTSNAVTVSSLASGSRKIYVDSSVGVSGNGASWSTAFKELREALPAAMRCSIIDTILIAKGTYKPAVGTNRDSTFLLSRSKLKIYGGYPTGGGTRNPAANPTLLSGDLGQPWSDFDYDNSYHIMVVAGIANTTDSVVLDGFTFLYSAYGDNSSQTATYNGVSLPIKGALALAGNDISMPVAVRNCTFYRNSNYSVYNQSSRLHLSDCQFADYWSGIVNRECTVSMNRCLFSGNYAYSAERGSMYNYKATVQVSECAFVGNHVVAVYNELSKGSFIRCRFDSNDNGGVFNRSSNMSYTGCSISGNQNSSLAGGMISTDSTTLVTNCIFYANQSAYGDGAITNSSGVSGWGRMVVINSSFFNNLGGPNRSSVTGGSGGTISFANCILWGNSNDTLHAITNPYIGITVSNSIVQGGYPGAAIYSLDPLFVNEANPAGADGVLGTADDGLTLQPCSVGINTGNVAVLPAGVSTDITGASRVQEIIDMGAYERASSFVNNKVYVDSSRTVSGDGTSWNSAFNNLRDALRYTNNCYRVDSILVAKGTYKPAAGTNQDSTFLITRSKLKIYGGYPTGGGTRNPATNPTILSGDIGEPWNDYDFYNSFHIMVAAGITNTSDSLVMDGFHFNYSNNGGPTTSTYNSIAIPHWGALAIAANDTNMLVTVRNCHFFADYGGAMYNKLARMSISDCSFTNNANVLNERCSVVMNRCFFSGNTTLYSNIPGTMYSYASSLQVSECVFVNNPSAALYNANCTGSFSKCRFDSNGYSYNAFGGVHNRFSNMSYTGCSISGNHSSNNAGGMVNVDSTTLVTNCVFNANQCSYNNRPGAILNAGGNSGRGRTVVTNCTFFDNQGGAGGPSITDGSNGGTVSFANCILWGNTNNTVMFTNNNATTTKVAYSIVQGGYAGTGNLDLNPRFIDSSTGNFDLQPCSPAINKGLVDSVPASIMNDFAGRTRIFNASIDMGVYECLSLPTTFMFTGNGNWNIVDNWQCNWLPPLPLPSGSKIFISPVAGGSCILNQPYTVSPGAELRVMPGTNLVVPGLRIQ